MNFEIAGGEMYKNLDDDTHTTYEFSLICDAVMDANPDIRESRFADKTVRTLVCEALDFIWGIARKRVNVNARYEYVVALRITRERLDRRTIPGMCDYITEAENWFRWEDDELILVNWLFRNPLDQAESEQRRRVVEKERKVKPESVKRMDRRRRQAMEDNADNVGGQGGQAVRTCPDFSEYAEADKSDNYPDTCPDNHHTYNNNNNNNNIQKHVSCSESSEQTPRPPITGSEALDETRRFLREIPLRESPTAACSASAFREVITFYFENDTHGNAVGLKNLPSGVQKYLERLYIDLSPYPPDVIRMAIQNELCRPMNPENPNDGMILQTMKRIIADSARIASTAERSEKERKRNEKIQSEAERERIAEEERERDAADFEALCELLSEGSEADIESVVEERYPMGIDLSPGERKMVVASRTRYRKKIKKRIQEIQKELVKA